MSKSILFLFFSALILLGHDATAQSTGLIAPADFIDQSLEAATLKPETLKRLQGIRQMKSVKTARLVKIDSSLSKASHITIQLSDGLILSISKKSEERRGTTDISWVGTLAGNGEAYLVFSGDSVSGLIQTNGRIFSIRNISPGVHVFLETDPTQLPPEHPVQHPSGTVLDEGTKAKSAADPTPQTLASAAIGSWPTIDVLVMYSPLAANKLGNVPAIAQVAIDRMNISFANSAVDLKVRLAAVAPVASDFMSSGAALAALTDATQIAINAKILRDQVLADVIIMVATFSDACGVARSYFASPANAFAVVDAGCFLENLSMAHEIGHLIGAGHNAENDSPPVGVAHAHGYHISWPATYSLYPAYNHTRCWHTIMSYPFSSFNNNNCAPDPETGIKDPKINYWSNPNIFYGDKAPFVPPGAQAGQGGSGNISPTGVASCCNNALVLNTNGAYTANLSATRISAGLIGAATITSITSLVIDDI